MKMALGGSQLAWLGTRRSDRVARIRMKAPRTKLQTPEKLQIPSSKAVCRQQALEFGAWDFSGAWCLGFGVSSVRLTPVICRRSGFAFRQLLKHPGFSVHPPQWRRPDRVQFQQCLSRKPSHLRQYCCGWRAVAVLALA